MLGRLLLQTGGTHMSVQGLVLTAGPFGKGILVLLIVLSIWSWAIIWDPTRRYARVRAADRSFLGEFRRMAPSAGIDLVADQHPESMLARLARIGQRSLDQHPYDPARPMLRIEIAQRAMERAA